MSESLRDIVFKAIHAEQRECAMEAGILYRDAVEELEKRLKREADPVQKKNLMLHLRECLLHEKTLKQQYEEHIQQSKLISLIKLEEDSRGNSYERLFGQYLTEDVKEVHIYEPNLCETQHMRNLTAFLEVLVKHCKNLRYVRLFTKREHRYPTSKQIVMLNAMQDNMQQAKIHLNFSFDNSSQDCRILLSNGIIIKIDHGLHYFKSCNGNCCLGSCDFDFRSCFETEVNILQTKPFIEKIKQPPKEQQNQLRSDSSFAFYGRQ